MVSTQIIYVHIVSLGVAYSLYSNLLYLSSKSVGKMKASQPHQQKFTLNNHICKEAVNYIYPNLHLLIPSYAAVY